MRVTQLAIGGAVLVLLPSATSAADNVLQLTDSGTSIQARVPAARGVESLRGSGERGASPAAGSRLLMRNVLEPRDHSKALPSLSARFEPAAARGTPGKTADSAGLVVGAGEAPRQLRLRVGYRWGKNRVSLGRMRTDRFLNEADVGRYGLGYTHKSDDGGVEFYSGFTLSNGAVAGARFSFD